MKIKNEIEFTWEIKEIDDEYHDIFVVASGVGPSKEIVIQEGTRYLNSYVEGRVLPTTTYELSVFELKYRVVM